MPDLAPKAGPGENWGRCERKIETEQKYYIKRIWVSSGSSNL